MQRYKLVLEYDGSHFKGWQKQPGLPTVQETIEKAIFSFTHETVEVYGAGRTDRGVHALCQVAHTDFARPMSPHAITQALNFYLRDQGVGVLEVCTMPGDFHARFSARQRGYLYRIIQRPVPLVLEHHRAWNVVGPLDIEAMREAATYLQGTHDFSSFRSTHCQARSPLRTLDCIEIIEFLDHPRNVLAVKGGIGFPEIRFYVRARSFLHHQVRSMVGALKKVGEGKWSTLKLKEVLEARNFCHGAPLAPPEGLYLDWVSYEVSGDPVTKPVTKPVS